MGAVTGAAAVAVHLCYQVGAAAQVAEPSWAGAFAGSGQATLPVPAQRGGQAPLPSLVIIPASAARGTPQAVIMPRPAASPAALPVTRSAPAAGMPLAGGGHAGVLLLSETGSRLASWDQTSALCQELPFRVTDGAVGTDASGDATLTVDGPGSCAALVSPDSYSSAVIEAEIYFPVLPGHPRTIANWTALWLTDDGGWPENGELDAVETEPVNGRNAVSWHSGTSEAQFVASTDGLVPARLPVSAPDLTPGWHTVDVVYTQGFFAVYYDGKQYTSYTSGHVTGDPLNIYVTTTVTPDSGSARQALGAPPVNSDSSPATVTVKYLRIWSYR